MEKGILSYYLLGVNGLALLVCLYDKFAAKKAPSKRIREDHLLLISTLGGSIAMYICMVLIRHKTKKRKFMLGIPLIFLVQILLFLYFQEKLTLFF